MSCALWMETKNMKEAYLNSIPEAKEKERERKNINQLSFQES